MTDYLLDTSMCIEMIRKRSEAAMERLRNCPPGTAGISAITLAELQYGASRSRDPERNSMALREFCGPLRILEFDERAAGAYGAVRSALEAEETPIGPLDTLIAAHALSEGALLVTANEREFARVAGLRVANWART